MGRVKEGFRHEKCIKAPEVLKEAGVLDGNGTIRILMNRFRTLI